MATSAEVKVSRFRLVRFHPKFASPGQCFGANMMISPCFASLKELLLSKSSVFFCRITAFVSYSRIAAVVSTKAHHHSEGFFLFIDRENDWLYAKCYARNYSSFFCTNSPFTVETLSFAANNFFSYVEKTISYLSY